MVSSCPNVLAIYKKNLNRSVVQYICFANQADAVAC